MATPTGTISAIDLNAEIIRETDVEVNLTRTRSLGEDDVRFLAGIPTGPISFADLRGRTWFFTINLISNVDSANIRILARIAGWDEQSPLQFIINSGVRVGPGFTLSETGSSAALVSTGDFPRGLNVINNGQVIGRGGGGGNGFGNGRGSRSASSTSGTGGRAGVEFSRTTRLINNGQIAGGGGGGGGAAAADQSDLGFGQRKTAAASSGAGPAGNGSRGSATTQASDSQAVTLGGKGGITTAGARASEAVARARMDFAYTQNSSQSAARGGAAGGLGAGGGAGVARRGDTLSAAGGGAAGLAIRRNRLITLVVQGTLNGPVEN